MAQSRITCGATSSWTLLLTCLRFCWAWRRLTTSVMLRYFSTLRLVLVTDESNENNDDMVAFVTPQAVDPTAGPSFSFRIRHLNICYLFKKIHYDNLTSYEVNATKNHPQKCGIQAFITPSLHHQLLTISYLVVSTKRNFNSQLFTFFFLIRNRLYPAEPVPRSCSCDTPPQYFYSFVTLCSILNPFVCLEFF